MKAFVSSFFKNIFLQFHTYNSVQVLNISDRSPTTFWKKLNNPLWSQVPSEFNLFKLDISFFKNSVLGFIIVSMKNPHNNVTNLPHAHTEKNTHYSK